MAMTKPLALLHYIHLLPGSQLANRLHELGYRVQVINELEGIDKVAQRETPILMIAEISRKTKEGTCAAIAALKANPATRHIPILAFSAEADKPLQSALLQSGASLLAGNLAILDQLPSLLDQILQVE